MDILASFVLLLVVTLALARHLRSRKQPRRDDHPNPKPSIQVLHPTDQASETEIDIMAVHGLGSDVDWSWTWKYGQRNVNWLSDLAMLPKLVPRARIMAYSYSSRWHAEAPITRLQTCGKDLIQNIHDFRGKSDRPLVLIGHSLGGLVIEYGLLWAGSRPAFKYLAQHTVGCLFLGTPFKGSSMSALAYLAALIMSHFGSHIGIIEDLAYDNHALYDKLDAFYGLRDSLALPVHCFFEKYATDYGRRFGISGVIRGLAVIGQSAYIPSSPPFSLDTDHLKLNKFSGPEDPSFVRVAVRTCDICSQAAGLLGRRKTRWQKRHIKLSDRIPGFVGREIILEQLLDAILPHKFADACQRTVLEGLGGVGKTRLALEAAYRLKDTAPEYSIFWVPALDETTFDKAYRKIERSTVVC